MKANTIRDVAYAAATVNNTPFCHYQGNLLCIGHNNSFDDVTAELGLFSLYAQSPVKEAQNFPNLKTRKRKLKKAMATIFCTNDQANKENMLGEKRFGG